ncbi:MAG TPA: TRAP transporter small permease subunit [Afifellaceae bacterium]|nr:TRAP transporter small permease subunit [Afifellaceae bacterium]
MGRVIRIIDAFTYRLGRTVMWLAALMALVQFLVVIMRYVFAVGSIPLQESIWYMHGILFMLGAGFALMVDGHVRVDIWYREAAPRAKAWIDLLGTLVFLLPVTIAIVWLSWGYVLNSWRVLESSTEVSGLPIIFLLKTTIWVFAALVALQGIALMLRALMTLTGQSDSYSAASPRRAARPTAGGPSAA